MKLKHFSPAKSLLANDNSFLPEMMLTERAAPVDIGWELNLTCQLITHIQV